MFLAIAFAFAAQTHAAEANGADGAGEASGEADAGARTAVTLDDVTVTATHRSGNLQQTAIAVTAINAEQLQERGVHTLADLAGQSAGLTLPGNYLNQRYVFIRGIGSARPAGNPSVGIYLDDVYLPRQFANAFSDLPDIERVEVLRGPQGTLYGQNTSSGAIRIIARTPDQDTRASADVQAGNLGALELKGYLAGALKPQLLSGSLAVSRRRNDGYTYNLSRQEKVNRFDTWQARGILLLTPSDELSLKLSLDGTYDTSSNAVNTPVPRAAGDSFEALPARQTLALWDTDTDLHTGGASLTAEYAASPSLTLKSITAWRRIDDDQPWQINGRPDLSNAFRQYIGQHQFSQELQLLGGTPRLEYVAGVSYLREQFDIDRQTFATSGIAVQRSYNHAISAGVFGEATWHATEALGITAGLRYARDSRELDADAYDSDADRQLLRQRFAVAGLKRDYSRTTPKLSLQYAFAPDLFGYLTAAEGITSGGWNTAPGTLSVALFPVEPEEVRSYEAGLKSQFLQRRGQANLALFYNDYKNYQTSLQNPTVNGVDIIGSVLSNADKAHTYGAELETAFRFTENFQARFNAAYLRTRFDSFLPRNVYSNTDFSGNELPYAPHQSYGLNAVYDVPLPSGNLRFNGALRYASEYFTGVDNVANQVSPAQTYLDGGVFYTTGDGRWTYSFTVKNLGDRTFATRDQYPSLSYNPPRQWLLGVRYDYF